MVCHCCHTCCNAECYPPDVKNPAAYNAAAVKSLYDAVDFIGLSSYPGFNGVDLSGMESATSQLAWELKVMGLLAICFALLRMHRGGGTGLKVGHCQLVKSSRSTI